MKTIFLFLFFISCSPSDETGEKQVMLIKNADTVVATPIVDTVKNEPPALVYFNQADCKGSQEEKLVRKKLIGDTLIVEMDMVLDCGSKYTGSFQLNEDTLDILLKLLPSQIIRHKNGKIDSIYSTKECYCNYKFLIKLNHMDHVPKRLLVNGRKIRTGFSKGFVIPVS